jgi:hypothetical protein
MSPDQVLRRVDAGVDFREIDGEMILLDSRRSIYLAINHAGTVLWNRLDAGATREDLVAGLMEAYPELSAESAAHDVDAFLEMLRENELVT